MTTMTISPEMGAVHLRRDLLSHGLTDNDIAALVRRGDLHRLRRGAYFLGSAGRLSDPIQKHLLLAEACARSRHSSSVLSHSSAAVLHGAEPWGLDLSTVHMTRVDGRPSRRESGVAVHRNVLTEEEVRSVNGLRVTSPARSVLEVLSQANVEVALVVANALLRRGVLTQAELAAEASRVARWPGTLGTIILLGLCDPRMESVAESRTVHLMWTHALPAPTPQFEVFDERGHLVGRTDFAWPEYGVFLEFDGKLKYQEHRRPGESLDSYLWREKRREERITLITGWRCVRLGWDDLERPALTAERIRRFLR